MNNTRELDLVVWGATGFTGKLVLSCLNGKQEDFFSCQLPNAGQQRKNVKYGIAGRNKTKLEKSLSDSNGNAANVPIFIADAKDEKAIEEFVKKTKVVVSCGGPFALYSDTLVGVCARLGTHYVDITGEAQWVRSVADRYDDLARASGAVICNMCGFDSIPFDLLALFAVNRLKQATNHTSGVRTAAAYLAMKGFGFSGGSLATGILQDRDPIQLTKGVDPADPFLLGGIRKGGARVEDTDESLHKVGKGPADLFTSPSVMHPVNSRVVRKSAGVLNYGEAFNYTEQNILPKQKSAEKAVNNAKNPAPPEVIEQLIKAGRLPKPGEGPTPDQRKQSKFNVIMQCVADDGTSMAFSCNGGEAGYEETARMVLEAGIQLAQNPLLCPGVKTGGVLTPACALGENMIRALNDIGIHFEVIEANQTALEFFQSSKL